MTDSSRMAKIALLVLGGVHLVYFCATQYAETRAVDGLLYPNGSPVGGDFINLWSAAKLVLSGGIADIYDVDRFMAYEQTFTGADIGLRLWAYPPHSLLLAWPLGFLGFYSAFVVWSVFGLAVLFLGARRFGFDRLETVVILISPATILNLYSGQTGSFATGLMLLALSPRKGNDQVSIVAAALLTIKPQTGFLLPLVWAFQRRWRTIGWTALATLALVAIAVAAFGVGPWRDYLGDTLPELSRLEREGSGPFMTMIPSAFMALRIVAGDADLALLVHGGFAVAVAAVLVVRLWRVNDATRQAALVLIATTLMTPYLHNYDLALLLCGALLVARRAPETGPKSTFVNVLVVLAWSLPQLVVTLNMTGLPISPLLILPLLFLA